jgi:predicted metalloprotease with PDZ domain
MNTFFSRVLHLAGALVTTVVLADTPPSVTPPKPSAWSDKPVTLQMRPVLAGGKFSAIDFSYTFVAPLSQTSAILALPNEWGGERELYRAWRDLRVEGAEIADGETIWQRKLSFKPSATVTLRYRIVAEGVEARKQHGNDYRPKIEASYFQLLGNAVVPQINGMWLGSPARFVLGGMPHGASFASDLEHGAMGRKMKVADLIESVLVGGDFRVLDAGGGARLAIRGKWPRSDDVWSAQFSRIAKSQRDFWGTGNEPFLVTILDLPDRGVGSISTGGTGRSDAFAFFSTTNASPERLDQTMAHEMMHTWVPRRIGFLPSKNEPLMYWLSEGFTDWTSWHTNVSSGLWQAEDFARAFNESLKAYETSPVRNAPNQAILDGFWRDPAVQSLPYQRGMLLATYWDQQVRLASSGKLSFVDVLREMIRQADANPNVLDQTIVYLRNAMKKIANIDISDDLARYVDGGETAPLAENVFAPCGTLVTIKRKVFHRGFDIDATLKANEVITGVITDGPAHAAGLRDGMKLVGRSGGEIGNSRVEIAYDVMDGDIKKTLRWMPEGKTLETIRELVLKKSFSNAERQACEQRLGRKN